MMGSVGLWRHPSNNNVLLLRRQYANMRYRDSKSLENARKMCCKLNVLPILPPAIFIINSVYWASSISYCDDSHVPQIK